MATLREWLNENGFDWSNGKILYQHVVDSDYPGWDSPKRAEYIATDHPVLDEEFDDGFGGPHCPRIIAEDAEAIYFPAQYDGSTWLEKVYKDISKYLDFNKYHAPYPGG